MEIDTPYAVKLFFSNVAFVQVYFEAVANALDAGAANISIRILTDGQIRGDKLEIVIQDDGEGFTDERFDRFRRLTEPSDPYHKGLGRLAYLHHFDSVHVESIFGSKKRIFKFSNTFNGSSKIIDASETDPQGTILRFCVFQGQRLKAYDDLKPSILKDRLLEHFLPLFHQRKKAGKPFQIKIETQPYSHSTQRDWLGDSKVITIADVPALKSKQFKDTTLELFADITMSYIVREGQGERQRLTAACIDGRTIPMPLLNANAIPANYSAIFLFESELFAGKSDSARQRLIYPEGITETTMHRALRRQISATLNQELPHLVKENARTRQQFEEQFPHLTGLFEEEDAVGLIDRDEAIELAQRRFFKKQKEVLESSAIDDATFEKSLEVSARALTEYIVYRQTIIRRLRDMNPTNLESDIHNLIVPQRKQFDGTSLVEGAYHNNAWLLDDKFMSFRTILSEKTMGELITAIKSDDDVVVDDGRPDIAIIFSGDPALVEKVDVVVVEMKRQGVDDKENITAVMQLADRANKLVDHCPAIQRAWYFAIIDVNDGLARKLSTMNWKPLFSRGRVFYQEFSPMRADGVVVPVPTYILSYNTVIEDAAARNHTFLEILKNGFKRHVAAVSSEQNDPSGT